MGRIEKTVFISYRRTNLPWALCIYQNLTMHGYDVFFDYLSIDSGNFEKVILENIKARAHFLVILTPSALERCKEPGDWLRREIETAMDEKRNIVPLMLESFDFGSPSIKDALTGKLASLNKFNGLRVYSEYFFEAMEKLRNRYLTVAIDDIELPELNTEAREITATQKIAASKASPVEKEQLTAQEWYERGYQFGESKTFEEEIRCYSEAVRLDPNFANAFFNRGLSRFDENDLEGAISDFNETIRLKSDDTAAYYYRGSAHHEKGNFEAAIADYTKAIQLKTDFWLAYLNRGLTQETKGRLEEAVLDYENVIRLKPDHGLAIISVFIALQKLGKKIEAQKYEELAFKLIKDENEYNQACFEAMYGNKDKALKLLKTGLGKKQGSIEWARQDPDLKNLRDDPRFKELVGE
jgi:tetratricopeptide (TPR) repeat protein